LPVTIKATLFVLKACGKSAGRIPGSEVSSSKKAMGGKVGVEAMCGTWPLL
jgi:hypothetical protein